MRWIKIALGVILFLITCFLGWHLIQNSRTEPEEILVVLDPGHGGNAPGAVYEGVQEKDLNLEVTLKVKDLLEKEPHMKVLLTRKEDETVELQDRADFSNQNQADLYVSIHANVLEGNPSFYGIMTFSHPDDEEGAKLAEYVLQGVTTSTNGKDLGPRTEDFAVLRLTDAPACLLEMGFMTNTEELARLQDPAYQARIAQGVVDGILAYVDEGRDFAILQSPFSVRSY